MLQGFQRILVASHTPGADTPLTRVAKRFHIASGDRSEVREIHLNGNDVLDGILHEADAFQSDLIVMGGRTHVLASKASMIAHCSVLMVPDSEGGISAALGHGTGILAAVDFSEPSREALRTAAWLASRESEKLYCVTVESEESPWHALRTESEQEIEHRHKVEALQSFAKETVDFPVICGAEPLDRSGALLNHPGLSFAHAIQGADVAATIEKAAQERSCELVVIGTRGRTRSTAILLGSVAEKVVQFSRRPVLVVKRRGENLGLFELLRGAAFRSEKGGEG